jgi:hypothetical protein
MTSLLADGSLAIEAAPEVAAAVEGWLPRVPHTAPPAPGAARIHAAAGAPPPAPAGAPVLELRSVGGWLCPGERVVLAEPGGRIGAGVDLAARRAEVRILAGETAETIGVEIFATLTICAALLLTRLGRAMVHAAAVVAPDGRARLLAGGTFSGKTSTCVTLIRGGWDWLADDHVVLSRAGDGGIAVEGWPRRFNLDHGYASAASQGARGRVEPDGFGPGRWRRSAPMGGLLFPRVEAERPTAAAPLHPAGALSLLLRHAPWLLADRAAAGPVLDLFQQAARLPAHELRLGRDGYCNASTLQFVLAATI